MKTLWISLVILFLFSLKLTAQSEFEKLTLLQADSEMSADEVAYNFRFETKTMEVTGTATTSMEKYDSISLQSYEYVKLNNDKVLKISGYIINRQTNHQLKWLASVDYIESAKRVYTETEQVLSGKFIQFGAFNSLSNATKELSGFAGFDIKLVKVNDQYKLIAPFNMEDFKKARMEYKEKEVWPVTYEKQQITLIE